MIPALNESATVGSVLEAVLGQRRPTGVELEVVVVDDGSEDDTAARARRFEGVVVAESDRLGPGGARNVGVQKSSGAVLTFLDSDDLWFPWTLASFSHAIEANGYPSFIAGNTVSFST